MILFRFKKAIILALSVGLFFAVMARIDYVVHSMLYNHGLEFSYDWANQYWIAYDASFVAFASVAAYTYWLGSPKTIQDKKCTVALFFTVNLLTFGGLEDLMYFTWGANLPAANVVWWWSPWINIFGTWNSVMQISLLTAAAATSALAWNIALRKKRTA